MIYKILFRNLLSVLALVIITFVFLRFMPGEDFRYEGEDLSVANLEVRKVSLKEQEILPAFLSFTSSVMEGHWGYSRLYDEPVLSVILSKAKLTLLISVFAMLMILALLMLALQIIWLNNSFFVFFDFLFRPVIQLPMIAWAPLLIYFTTYRFEIFPTALLLTPWHWVLPIFILSFRPFCHIYILLADKVRQFKAEDFVRFARAKGLSEQTIFLRHILKRILPEGIRFLFPTFSGLIAGAFLVEYMFAIPGMGSLFLKAFEARDLFLLGGLCLFSGILLLIFKFAADLLVNWADPRLSDLEKN